MVLARAWAVFGCLLVLGVSSARAQTSPPAGEPLRESSGQWRNPNTGEPAAGTSGMSSGPIEPARAITNPGRRPIAKVTQGPSRLPDENGQVWREYDITPYTLRVTTTNRPEQAIVDWILRETGYEAWHGEPVSVLSANSRSLKVYHTPEMHATVAEVVDRFVSTEAETQAFSMRMIALGSTSWRSRAQPVLRPLPVQTQGIQAWLVHKEDAAVMLAELRKRLDFHEYGTPHVLINNGQPSVVSTTQSRMYVRDIVARPGGWPAFEQQTAQFDQGFTLELNPLLSLDGRSVDAIIKCNIDQLEKMHAVNVDIPTPGAPPQRAKIEVPQVSQCRLHERFRWPVDEVLVVGLGEVPLPVPSDQTAVLGLPVIGAANQRADLLIFVEHKGPVTAGSATPPGTPPPPAQPATASRPNPAGVPERPNYSGRF